MKRMIAALLLGAFALTLSACAGTSLSPKAQVKFPAKGYEFETPMGG